MTSPPSRSSTAAYGIGIIGLGTIGRRMAQSFAEHAAFRVIGAYDPAPLAPSAGQADVPMLGSAEALLGDPRVRCVYIASPPSTHLGYVQAAARAGKAVFCEKPLTVSPAEARACCEAVAQAGLPSAVNFPFATGWAARQMRHLVADGALGQVHTAHLTLRFARWPRAWQVGAESWLARPEQGGFVREVGSHFIFLAGRMFGPGRVESVDLQRSPQGTEHSLRATLRFGEVVMHIDGAISGNLADVNRFEVAGDEGTTALTDWQRLDYRGKLSERINSLPHLLEALRLLLAGDSAHGLATMDEAARVVETVEAILQR